MADDTQPVDTRKDDMQRMAKETQNTEFRKADMKRDAAIKLAHEIYDADQNKIWSAYYLEMTKIDSWMSNINTNKDVD